MNLNETLPDFGGAGLAGHPVDPGFEMDLTSLWETVDSGLLGSNEDFVWRPEADLDEPSDTGPAPHYAPDCNFPVRRRLPPGAGRQLAEDFEDERERGAFLLLCEKLRNCWASEAGERDRSIALDWVFTITDQEGPSFDLCCRALGIRPHVVRMRLHFQWYLAGRRFERPFPFFLVPIPNALEGELLYWGGEEAVVLATRAWRFPGTANIAHTTEEMKLAWMLEERGFLGETGGGWYVIGRNPQKIHYASRGWASLW